MTGPYPLPGDGNTWVLGACWFWCGHRVTLVVRLGAVSTAEPPAGAPLYASLIALFHRLLRLLADGGEQP